MTKPNNGKFDTKIHPFNETSNEKELISRMNGQAASVLLTIGLTIFMAVKRQYVYALCSAALSLCACTSERLRRLRIGLHGFSSEWSAPASRVARIKKGGGQT